MTKQEAIETLLQIATRNIFCTLEKEQLNAFEIAINCIQECIDKERPCVECIRESCKGCLYSNRLG